MELRVEVGAGGRGEGGIKPEVKCRSLEERNKQIISLKTAAENWLVTRALRKAGFPGAVMAVKT